MTNDLPSHSPAHRLIDGRGTDEATWNASPGFADLPIVDVATWSERFGRIFVLAPHPDDEILALGGTLSRLSAQGADIHILSVTDGEASHEGSTAWTHERLIQARPEEMLRGLGRLAVKARVSRLGLPDGRVGGHREVLLKRLLACVSEGDLLLTTCRFDGHPDHEACGDVALLAGELTGATVFEYPVWMWHWAGPDEALIPWGRAHRLPIDADRVHRKREAIGEFTSQIEADGAHEAILPPNVVARFVRPFEVVFL